MRELTRAETRTVSGAAAVDHQALSTLFDQKFHDARHAEVHAQMARVVRQLQDSVRTSS